jgi:hypothetical protein
MESTTQQVVASLEGMKIVVANRKCELHEYNFEVDLWTEIESMAHPMLRSDADRWVRGWNTVDRISAVSALVGYTSKDESL